MSGCFFSGEATLGSSFGAFSNAASLNSTESKPGSFARSYTIVFKFSDCFSKSAFVSL